MKRGLIRPMSAEQPVARFMRGRRTKRKFQRMYVPERVSEYLSGRRKAGPGGGRCTEAFELCQRRACKPCEGFERQEVVRRGCLAGRV